MNKRFSRHITDKSEIDYFLSFDEELLQRKSFMMEMFGLFKGKSKYHPYDTFDVPVGSYGPEDDKNTNVFRTTLGLWIFNKFFIEKRLFKLFGYITKTMNKKVLGKINEKMSYALLEDKITLEDMKDFLMKTQKYQEYIIIISPHQTEFFFLAVKDIEKKKKELFKKYEKELERNKLVAVDKIEKELIEYSKDLLKDDPSVDTYNTGTKVNFANCFKDLYIMRGMTKDPISGEYKLISSCYNSGISKEDYAKVANSMTEGPYKRAKKTAIGGYWEKLFLPAYQHIKVAPPGTDCGTNRTITVTLTPKNIGMYMYSYIKEGSKLIELTSENKDHYLGKTVKFRFSSLCEYKKPDYICHKCAGNMFNRVGIVNIGTTTPQYASKIKLISMKAFHDAQINLHEIDVEKVFNPF